MSGCVGGYFQGSDNPNTYGRSGSMSPEEDGDSEGGPELSDFAREVKSRVKTYDSSGFEKVTETPFPSEAAAGKEIALWISDEGVADYLSATDGEGTSPDAPALPKGSVIVREIRSESGDVEKLTLIAQREKDFHPQVGGLWFGVMSPDGDYETIQGRPEAGAIASCAGCHTAEADTAHLFGVPTNHLAVDMVGGDEDRTPSKRRMNDKKKSPPKKMKGDGPTFDTSGLRIVNREEDLSRKQSAELRKSPTLDAGDILVVARRASKEAFERHWGVTLGDDVVFINQDQQSGFSAPIVNGGEIWEVRDERGNRLAGPTPEGDKGKSHQRVDFTGNARADWKAAASAAATPGTSAIDANHPGRRPGLFISEWSDGAGEYRMEFIELRWIPGR